MSGCSRRRRGGAQRAAGAARPSSAPDFLPVPATQSASDAEEAGPVPRPSQAQYLRDQAVGFLRIKAPPPSPSREPSPPRSEEPRGGAPAPTAAVFAARAAGCAAVSGGASDGARGRDHNPPRGDRTAKGGAGGEAPALGCLGGAVGAQGWGLRSSASHTPILGAMRGVALWGWVDDVLTATFAEPGGMSEPGKYFDASDPAHRPNRGLVLGGTCRPQHPIVRSRRHIVHRRRRGEAHLMR
ncbi:hypothetical protein N9L19_00450 [bacterium]|nr:hypothetical protein [bacterium]